MSDLTPAEIRKAVNDRFPDDYLGVLILAAERYADALERGVVIVPDVCQTCGGKGKVAVHDQHGVWGETCPSCGGTAHEWDIPAKALNAVHEQLLWACWTPDGPEPEDMEEMIDSDDVASIVRAFLDALRQAMKEEG